MDLVIYGAQSMALGAYEAIQNLFPTKRIRCFLVTERGINAEYLAGIPVLELVFFSESLSEKEKKEVEIIIATPEDMMSVIESSLDKYGLFCHVRLTSPRWATLMGCYYIRKGYMPLHALPVGYHKVNIHVFMAKFYKDTPLSEPYDLPGWIIPIQAGAALCTERVAEYLDCVGDHISFKNVNYSELTALYWIWKNCLIEHSECKEYEYYGLTHYRRILELSQDDLLRLADNEVDVVLPYPMPYEPDIEEHHKRYLKRGDWDAVWKAVMELQPDYIEAFQHVLKQRLLYNYNIIVAKKEVLADYCRWLFPILKRIEELSVPKGHERSDRYIGYVGETLETLYFMYHRDKLNIVHTGCIFLS